MKKFNILTTIMILSFFVLSIACDDNFNNKIETEREIAQSKNDNDNDNDNGHDDPKLFYPGNDGVILVKYLGDHMVRIKWWKSRDFDSNPLDVTYTLYYSFENNLITPGDARNFGTYVYEGYNFNMYTFTGLIADKVYYFNILAEDGDGNEIMYNTIAVETLEEGFFDHSNH